jgi:phosphoglycerate dehydrogenase-like enzyme
MNVVLMQGRLAVPRAEMLRVRLGDDWRVTVWDPDSNTVAEFPALAAEADVIVGGAIPIAPWPETPKLKLIQIPFTGHEWTSPEQNPKGVPVCNCYEHETSIAEYVLLAMLEWKIGLRHMDALFRAKGWDGRGVATGPVHGEVRGTTVGVIGYGHIGHEVAVRARAFEMNVVGIRRSQPPCPPELDWLGTMERLDELLNVSDFVLVACDLNAETRGLINEARLMQMKPGGVIINVSRGKVVDEAALYAALKERRIGGAVIDVWYNYNQQGKPEVWPTNFPFQDLDNVICSAHECGWTQEQVDRRWDFVAENMERVVRGEAPESLAFVGTGG